MLVIIPSGCLVIKIYLFVKDYYINKQTKLPLKSNLDNMVHSKLWFSISTYNLKTVPGILTFHNSRSQNSNIEFTILLLYNQGTKWIRFSRLKILELNKKYLHLSRKRSIHLYIGVPPLPQEYILGFRRSNPFSRLSIKAKIILRHREQ